MPLADWFSLLGGNTTRPQFPGQNSCGANFHEPLEHHPNGFGLSLADHQFPVSDIITHGRVLAARKLACVDGEEFAEEVAGVNSGIWRKTETGSNGIVRRKL